MFCLGDSSPVEVAFKVVDHFLGVHVVVFDCVGLEISWLICCICLCKVQLSSKSAYLISNVVAICVAALALYFVFVFKFLSSVVCCVDLCDGWCWLLVIIDSWFNVWVVQYEVGKRCKLQVVWYWLMFEVWRVATVVVKLH